MKTMILGAFAAMMLSGGLAYADTGATYATHAPALTDTAQFGQASHADTGLWADNPVNGLPSYELQSDGLMVNGLLPAPGWQG